MDYKIINKQTMLKIIRKTCICFYKKDVYSYMIKISFGCKRFFNNIFYVFFMFSGTSASFGVNCDMPGLHFPDTCVTDNGRVYTIELVNIDMPLTNTILSCVNRLP